MRDDTKKSADEPLRIDRTDRDLKALSGFGGRIAALLGAAGGTSESSPHLVATLDDLLGAVYSLIFAKHLGFKDRTTQAIETDAIRRRAQGLARGTVRIEGPWLAGHHFNSAIFRLAAVYHRALKVVVGVNEAKDDVHTLRPKATDLFQKWMKRAWSRQNIDKIHDQVNTLKHSSRGQFHRRKVKYSHALAATQELLELLEAWHVTKRRQSV